MGLTFAEKVLSAKLGREVHAGEIINVEPDLVLSHDNSAAIAKTFKSIGVDKVRHPERLVIVLDHCVPAADFKHATNHKQIREFVAAQGIRAFFDIQAGVCHQVVMEHGFALPGMLCVGSDSHTTTYGASGAFAAGIGRTETACTWATGELWLRVPDTLRIRVGGRLPRRVSSKDLVLAAVGQLGADGADYKSVEWCGPAIEALSVDARMPLCNMAAEMGAKNGYVPPDAKTVEWLASVGADPSVGPWWLGQGGRTQGSAPTGESWHSDPDAVIAATCEIDASALGPVIACPHRVDNVKPVAELQGKRVQQCLLGTCTNGRIEDMEEALEVLGDHKVHSGTRLLVFPASQRVNREALKRGYAERFIDAGAIWMNPGCGPCLGAHEGALAPGETCLSTSNRNFKGRMGTPESEIYLGSPQSVAAAAVAGEICDPREV
jgi:3-isopropylmalate/(R)-2-methylmalate dehydratase large subunit